MKGCGFHQSDAAHHCTGVFVVLAVEFRVSGVAPPRCLLSLRLTCIQRPDPHSIREGSGTGRSDSCELNRDWVRRFCLPAVWVELRVTGAGVILQPAAAQVGS